MKKKLLLVLLSVPALIFYECKAFDQNPSLTSALPRASSRENNIFLLLSGIGIVPYDADLDFRQSRLPRTSSMHIVGHTGSPISTPDSRNSHSPLRRHSPTALLEELAQPESPLARFSGPEFAGNDVNTSPLSTSAALGSNQVFKGAELVVIPLASSAIRSSAQVQTPIAQHARTQTLPEVETPTSSCCACFGR